MNTNILFSLLLSICALTCQVSFANSNAVKYHCPSVVEASDTFDIRTTQNNNDVRWAWSAKKTSLDEKPVEFTNVALVISDENSLDRSILCVYKSNLNRVLIASPVNNWYKDLNGVASGIVGNNWKKLSDNSLTCNQSSNSCVFILK